MNTNHSLVLDFLPDQNKVGEQLNALTKVNTSWL